MYGKPLRKSAESAIDRLKPSPFKHIKKRVTFVTLFLIVVKVPQQEPFDKDIISSKYLYSILINTLKQSTQEYYNMRLVLGLEVA